MRLTTLILITAILQVSANSFAQKISLSEKNASLNKVFDQIRSQTGYDFFFTTSILQQARPVTVNVKNEELETVLKKIFEGQDLEYAINKKSVMVTKKTPSFLDRVVDAFTPPIDISGLVLDEKGLPLAGVTVRVKGSSKATSTDNAGKFYLAGVDDDAVIEFRMVGYKTLELSAKGKFEGLRMEVLSKDLEEVVVAYGKTTQQALTGAVTVISGEQIQNLPNRSFDKSLQGLVPGLQITGGTGQPGGGMSSMVQRGISTGGDALSGSTLRNPLIVIDGIPVSQDNFITGISSFGTSITNPIAQLNPSDIESLSFLKDATAIALYGSKASNGVILVTTKKGKTGDVVFGFRSQIDYSILPKRFLKSVLNQEDYLQLLFDTYKNSNSTTWTDNAIRKDLYSKFPYKISGLDTMFYAQPDWEDAIYEKYAPTFINEISMSGANEKTNYYLNFEYTKQDGIVKHTGYDRKSFRINFERKPTSWLNLGTRTFLSYNVQDYSNAIEGPNSYGSIPTMSPLNPIRREDGNFIWVYPWGGPGGSQTLNPLAQLENNPSKNTSYRGISKIFAEASFLKYFNFSSNLGIDFMLSEIFEKTDPRFRQGTSNLSTMSERDVRRTNLISTNLLSFSMPIKSNHDIKVLIGQEAQILTSHLLSGTVRGDTTTLPAYDQLTSPSYTMSTLLGSKTRQTLLSWFGQFNYAFKKKYFISSSFRRDGSSRFGSRELWGNFWSIGTGWVITEENFLAKSNYVTYLKVRGSIGIAGNSGAVSPTTKFEVLQQGLYGGRTSVVMPANPGNLDIRWEKTSSWNLGMDARLLQERVSITVDLYNKKTEDLIYQVNLPSTSGYRSVNDNIGNISNRGIEISLAGNIIANNNLKWTSTATWSSNKNILVKANVPFMSISSGTLANEVGRNFNSLYLRRWAGVNPIDGTPQWFDASGKTTSNYSAGQREFVGKPQPDGYGIFNNNIAYKKFDLSVQFYYQYGNQFINDRLRLLQNDGVLPYLNQSKSALDYWKKPGDISDNPRRILNNADGGYNVSTRYLFDASYLKLNTVSLSYNISKSLLNKVKIKSAKVYLQGNNLAIWTKSSDQDPDNVNMAGIASNSYPNAKNFSIGLQANF